MDNRVGVQMLTAQISFMWQYSMWARKGVHTTSQNALQVKSVKSQRQVLGDQECHYSLAPQSNTLADKVGPNALGGNHNTHDTPIIMHACL